MKRRWRPTDVPFIKSTANVFDVRVLPQASAFFRSDHARSTRKCRNLCYDLGLR